MNPDRISLLRDSSALISSNPVLINNDSSGYDTLDTCGHSSGTTPPGLDKPKKLPQYVAAISATLSALAAGLALGWTSPILNQLKHGKLNGIIINDNQMGWIGSFVTLGAMTMCIPTGFICDMIGRRKALLLLIIPFSVGWLLIYFASSVLMLYFGRLITGMAVGASCVAAPLYANEIAHKDIRGTLGSYFQLMIVTGIFLAYLVGKYLDPIHFTIFCSVVPFLFVICIAFQPESPIFCLQRGLYCEAQAGLTRLRGKFYDVDSEFLEAEGALKERTQVSVSLLQTLHQRATKRALFMALSLMFFQQFCGINAVILYTSDIFGSTGIKLDPNSATIIVGAFQVVATFISSLLVDKLGRRILLCVSGFVMSMSTICLALYFFLKFREKVGSNTLDHLSFLPILSLCIFIVMFSIGFGPIPWMFASEIFPPEIRGLAVSVTGTFNWFLAFLITKFYLQIKDSIGEDTTFYIFSLLSFLSMLFVYFVIPETKGKSIEEIQAELND